MAVKDFLNKDKELLHKKCEKVNMKDVKLVEMLHYQLTSAYRRLGGAVQGLAAPQVYEYYRAVLCRFTKGREPEVWYNPKILVRLGSKESNEGCESEGKQRYIVKRARVILVSYISYLGVLHVKVLGFKKGRIVQHEVDHLNGILLSDHGIKARN